jgi:agarase
VTQKRLFYRDGEVQYQPSVGHADASAIPVDVEETTIVTLNLEQPLDTQGTSERKTHYAAGTALDSKATADHEFNIQVDNAANIQSAKLVVGIQRKGGLQKPLAVNVNGNAISIDNESVKDCNNLFASLSVNLRTDQLKDSNAITIDPQDGLTITSVHLVTQQVAAK